MCFCVSHSMFELLQDPMRFVLYIKQVQLSKYSWASNVLLIFWSSKDLFEWTLNGTDHSRFIKHIFICVSKMKKSQIWNYMNFKFWVSHPFKAILYNVIVENSVFCFRSLERVLFCFWMIIIMYTKQHLNITDLFWCRRIWPAFPKPRHWISLWWPLLQQTS